MVENSRDGNFTSHPSSSLSTPDPSWLAIEQSGVLDNAPSLSKTPLTRLRQRQSEFGIKSDVTPTNLDIEDLQITVSDGSSIAVRVYRPHTKVGILPICVVYHGGGWTIGDLDTEDGNSPLVMKLTSSFLSFHLRRWTCNSRVSRLPTVPCIFSSSYSSSPENMFPVPLNDCFDTYKWVAFSR